ncbi:MAG TPA: hypothetical protein VK421_02240 [Pyrinomonadaceae bacterium]|nr:hypothetical protein [Pyrinomonadaceae bacterium]
MSGKDWGQKLVAILVVIAMLALMGIPLSVLVFFSVVVFFVWRAVDRSEQHETRRVFEFYLAAHEILRDGERNWYGFEIGEAASQGEAVLHSMRDAPPLVHFALGALYQRAGDHEAAAEHLAYVVENESASEAQHNDPSPELRRYVSVLRRLEREPVEGPQTVAAVRSLERLRRASAGAMLAESRSRLGVARPPQVQQSGPARERLTPPTPFDLGASRHAPAPAQNPAAPPPQPAPIAEVLRDLYEEEKKTA